MIPAFGIAVSGLIDATTRANTAASNIVRGSTAASTFSLDMMEATASYARTAAQSDADAGAPPASMGRQPPVHAAMPRYIPSMAEDMVMMREAVNAYKANANVIRQLDQIAGELINVLKTDERS